VINRYEKKQVMLRLGDFMNITGEILDWNKSVALTDVANSTLNVTFDDDDGQLNATRSSSSSSWTALDRAALAWMMSVRCAHFPI